jgi:hypothetical protein
MIPPNYFDRSKPFYPIVMNYIIQLIGYKELLVRGLVGPPDEDERLQLLLRKFPRAREEAEQNKEGLDKLREQIEVLTGPLKLVSVFQNNTITVEIDEMAQDVSENYLYLAWGMLPAIGNIFIVAYETAKEQGWHNTGPLWEFLRHCRHAAAHGGRFTFRGREPVRPAKWEHLEITREMQGLPLFKNAEGVGFLSLGDPIRLLWDIEQANPQMQASKPEGL